MNKTQLKLLKRAATKQHHRQPGHVLSAGKLEYREALKFGWTLVREDTGAGAIWKHDLTTV